MHNCYSLKESWVEVVSKIDRGEVKKFEISAKGEHCLFLYIKRDISDEITSLEKGQWFDIITPFDYGGIYYSSKSILELFFTEFEKHCINENIISGFFRFNPMLEQEYEIYKQYIELVKIQDHIVIKLDAQYKTEFSSRKIRNIKKANNLDINFIIDDSVENFHPVYINAMNRIQANDYYYFEPSLLNDLRKFGKIFSLTIDSEVVSSIFIIEDDENVYYFLGGTNAEYLKQGVNSLLFDKVCQFYLNKKQCFFLGGGKHGLYDYKKEFSKDTLPFYIGKKIFREDIYIELSRLVSNDESYFPRYRNKVI